MKNFVVILIFFLITVLFLSGCNLSSILSNEKYENYAIFAQSNPPELTDGNLNSIAEVPEGDTRLFEIRFAEPKHILQIVIHNHNLYRFKIEYWDERLQKWKILESVQQRREIEGISRRIQKKYTFKNVNCITDKMRIEVSRTVDDRVVTKTSVAPDDIIVDIDRGGSIYGYREYYKVLKRSSASIREIQIFGLPESEELF